jgi:hypothetical protein
VIYDLLFKASAETTLTIATAPRRECGESRGVARRRCRVGSKWQDSKGSGEGVCERNRRAGSESPARVSPCSVDQVVRGLFHGEIWAKNLGGVSVSQVTSGRQRVLRTAADIARSPAPLYFVNVQVAGAGSFRQGAAERNMACGDIFFILGQEEIKSDKVATIWNAATPSSSRRWQKFCVSSLPIQKILIAFQWRLCKLGNWLTP